MASKRSEIKKPTVVSGTDLLNLPILNKGTAFTEAERKQLGLEGLLPPHVETLDEQVVRAYEAYQRKNDDLERHIYLRALQDTNEVLFYRLLLDHIGIITPFADAASPIYANSGYLPARDYWRLGTIFGAIFLVMFLVLGVPWASLLWK